MPEWIAHDGRGYPFDLIDEEGNALPQPTVLVRIRALDRLTVDEKGNWMEATKWREWRHNGGPGDIIEYLVKE